MVNPGRVACIFTPFVLSLGCLVCLVILFLAGTLDRNKTLDDMYFLKVSETTIIPTDTKSDSSISQI